MLFIPQKPDQDTWGSTLEAMQTALNLEKTVNQALLDLHNVATDRKDPHVSNSNIIQFQATNYQVMWKPHQIKRYCQLQSIVLQWHLMAASTLVLRCRGFPILLLLM